MHVIATCRETGRYPILIRDQLVTAAALYGRVILDSAVKLFKGAQFEAQRFLLIDCALAQKLRVSSARKGLMAIWASVIATPNLKSESYHFSRHLHLSDFNDHSVQSRPMTFSIMIRSIEMFLFVVSCDKVNRPFGGFFLGIFSQKISDARIYPLSLSSLHELGPCSFHFPSSTKSEPSVFFAVVPTCNNFFFQRSQNQT